MAGKQQKAPNLTIAWSMKEAILPGNLHGAVAVVRF